MEKLKNNQVNYPQELTIFENDPKAGMDRLNDRYRACDYDAVGASAIRIARLARLINTYRNKTDQ